MKRFKDPIYGYINIPRNLVKNIIDTPEFQRLRYIRQTSYLPVYSAALHNRFIHSLGVYHLGVKAYNAVLANSGKILNEHLKNLNIGEIFQLACLLHDVGHAPFSHSGEKYYLLDDRTLVDSQLKDEVHEDLFATDMEYYHKNGKVAAPHEIMSAAVALNRFDTFFPKNEQRSFFARCITGYKYRDADVNIQHAVCNAFISLLNSTTIDVDRLDYLIRDAFVMGYNSISIDYSRLLDSATLVEVQDARGSQPVIQLAFQKSALSVVENVIYAHDSERKWIQNHPVIMYEVFLIQRILLSVKKDYAQRTGRELFSRESLFPATNATKTNGAYEQAMRELQESIEFLEKDVPDSDILPKLKRAEKCIERLIHPSDISLLCDDDIIHYAKLIHEPLCDELFDRQQRRHPIWKSEAEYNIYIDGLIGDDVQPTLTNQIDALTSFLSEEAPSPCINQDAIDYCQAQLEKINTTELSDSDRQDMRDRYNFLLRWLTGFRGIKEAEGLKEFDFVLIPASKFESEFKKQDLGRLPIYFPETGRTYPLDRLINLFSIKDNDRQKFFYIYYRKSEGDALDSFQVGKAIAKLALE